MLPHPLPRWQRLCEATKGLVNGKEEGRVGGTLIELLSA